MKSFLFKLMGRIILAVGVFHFILMLLFSILKLTHPESLPAWSSVIVQFIFSWVLIILGLSSYSTIRAKDLSTNKSVQTGGDR